VALLERKSGLKISFSTEITRGRLPLEEKPHLRHRTRRLHRTEVGPGQQRAPLATIPPIITRLLHT
jgi:hypothetical protein